MYRFISSIKDVRNFFNTLMGDSLTYEFPYRFDVKYFNREGEWQDPVTISSLKKNSKSSRPRLQTEEGILIEIAHCSSTQLITETRTLQAFLKDEREVARRESDIQYVLPHLGRDLVKELDAIGISFSKLFRTGKQPNLILDKDELLSMSSGDIEFIKNTIDAVDDILERNKFFEMTTYSQLSPAEKAEFHKLQVLKDNNHIHYDIASIWRNTDDFGTYVPVLGSCGFIKDKVDELNRYFFDNNIDKIYYNEASTAATENLYSLIKTGWKIQGVTELVRDGLVKHQVETLILVRYENKV